MHPRAPIRKAEKRNVKHEQELAWNQNAVKREREGGIQVLIIELVEFGLEMSALDSRSININGTERDTFRFPTRFITYSCFTSSSSNRLK